MQETGESCVRVQGSRFGHIFNKGMTLLLSVNLKISFTITISLILRLSFNSIWCIIKNDLDTACLIGMNGQQLEEVTVFKYIGAMHTKDEHSTVVIKRILTIATAWAN